MGNKDRSAKERRRKDRAQARKARDAKRNVRAPERAEALGRALLSGAPQDWAHFMSVNGDNSLFPVPPHYDQVLAVLQDDDMRTIEVLAASYSKATQDGSSGLLAFERDAAGIDSLDASVFTPDRLADGSDPFLFVTALEDDEVIRAIVMWLPSIDRSFTPLVIAGNARAYGVWVIDEAGTWLPCTAPIKYWARFIISAKWRIFDRGVLDALLAILPGLGAPAEVSQMFAIGDDLPGHDKPNSYQHPAVSQAFAITSTIAQDHLDVAADLAYQLVRERALSVEIMDYAAGYRAHVENDQPALLELRHELQAARGEVEQLRVERDALAGQLKRAVAQAEEPRLRQVPTATETLAPAPMNTRLASLFAIA